VLREEDQLLIVTSEAGCQDFKLLGLEEVAIVPGKRRPLNNELGLVEVVVSPRSRLINKNIRELHFRQRYGMLVLGILRAGEKQRVADDVRDERTLIEYKLAMGDTLLLGGPWSRIEALQRSHRDLLVLHQSSNWRDAAPAYRKAPHAIAILVALIVLMIFNIVPAVTAVIMASVALVLTGCLAMTHVYRCIDWKSLVLIAGMLPMATALKKTGGITFIVDSLLAGMGGMGPYAIMAILFLLTAVFSQFISNTATAVLVTPIGIGISGQLDVSPQPVVMAIALAASAAFVTPVASPVNTLVLGPGGYRFQDFVKVGIPLLVMTLVLTLLIVPLVFPF
jgi:di/tricarboxylate transporter